MAKPGRAGSKAHSQHAQQAQHAPHAQASAPSTPLRGNSSGLAPVAGTSVDPMPPALDRLIHERLRLGIVSALAVNDVLSFSELKTLLRTTDGNLSVHARKLEDADYITCTKTFEGRVPHTQYSLTASGRAALKRYLDHMEALIRATRDR